ncbi:MAG: type II toxin-antitoxin system VapC family toxin [Candidatus Limnocylindria bacterium]
MAVVVDTSVLYALVDASDAAHKRTVEALRSEVEAVIVPQATLPEVCYLIGSRLGAAREAEFVRHLAASDWRLEPLTDADLPRVHAVMHEYVDAKIGFVDATVVAVAERVGVTRIHTLDRQHFAMIRPAHVDRFELLATP